MGDLIQFPTKPLRDWVTVEGKIKDQLVRAGASDEMIAEVIPRMQSYWMKFDVPLSFSFNLETPERGSDILMMDIENSVRKAATDFIKKIQKHNFDLLIDRLVLEIDLYKAKRGLLKD